MKPILKDLCFTYRQTRVGKDNKDFKLFKFRSMKPDSDKSSLITMVGRDPRVTRSGYYIRKYKLDEFPQLINVFKGDMSLVGPRPGVRRYVNIEQVLPDKLAIDLEYVDKASLWNDIKLIFKTFKEIASK